MIPDFDLTGSVGRAYQTVLAERAYVLRLMAIPFAVTVAMTLLSFALDWQDDFPRHALVMIPAWFTQGWMIAQFLRTLLTGERWPYLVDLNKPYDQSALFWRVRGLITAIILFVLAQMATACLFAVMFHLFPPDLQDAADAGAQAVTPPEGGSFLTALGLLLFLVLSFPLFWLAIPAVINIPLRPYVRAIAGWYSPLQMIGVWMVVTIPITVLVFFTQSLLLTPYAWDVKAAPSLVVVTVVIIQALAENMLGIISATALTFALMGLLKRLAGAAASS